MVKEQQAVARPQPQTTTEQSKKKKTWLWILLGCGGCLLCVIVAIVIFVVMIGAGAYSAYRVAKDSIADQNLLCKVDNNEDLREAYEDFMTDDYQDTVSFSEFEDMYDDNEEFFLDCSAILPELRDLVGFNATSDASGTTLAYSKKIDGGKTAEIEMVIDDNGNILLDNLTISQ